MIEIKNISKMADNGIGVRDISFEIGKDGLIVLLGKSGSGKSLLLKLLSGLETIDSGDIEINGKSLDNYSKKMMRDYRNSFISYIPEDFALLNNKTIKQNIELSLDFQNKEIEDNELEKLLLTVGLDKNPKTKVKNLNSEEKARVAIARALVKNPSIILIDDFSYYLDSITTKIIYDLLRKIGKTKLIIAATNDSEICYKYASRVIELKDGKIIGDNSKEKIIPINNVIKINKAKMPLKYAFAWALRNFLHNTVLLIFLICFVVLTTICSNILLSTNIKVPNDKIRKSMTENIVWVNKYNKNYIAGSLFNVNIDGPRKLSISDDEVIAMNAKAKTTFKKEYTFIFNNERTRFKYDKGYTTYYYNNELVNKFVKIDKEFTNIIGSMPVNKADVIIHKYLADNIINYGINGIKFKTYNDILGKDLLLTNNTTVKVVGIINDDLSAYKNKYSNKSNINFNSIRNSLYNRIYVKPEYIDTVSITKYSKELTETPIKYENTSFIINGYSFLTSEIDYYNNEGLGKVSNLSVNDIILDEKALNIISNNEYYEGLNNTTDLENYRISFIKNYIGKEININNKTLKIKGIDFNTNKGIVYVNKVNENFNSNLIISSVYSDDISDKTYKDITNKYPFTNHTFVSSTTNSYKSIILYEEGKELSKYAIIGLMICIIITFILLYNYMKYSMKYRKFERRLFNMLGCSFILVDIIQFILLFILLFILSLLLNKIIFNNDLLIFNLNTYILCFIPITVIYLISILKLKNERY